ncbi:AAA family ATPase [Vibrio fluvialis]
MYLKRLSVINLWHGSSVKLDFSHRVTFLTGVNGSGKSSLLNIIYDSLHINKDNGFATSKNRLWSSNCMLENDVMLNTIILPPIPESKQTEIGKLISSHKSKNNSAEIYNKELIEKIKNVYEKDKLLSHVTFQNQNIKGQGYIHAIGFPKGTPQKDKDHYQQELMERPKAFLFQEDRNNLHNLKNSNLDPRLEFWSTYGSSIDTRFFYIRDAMHIRESQLDSSLSKLIEEHNFDMHALIEDSAYSDIQSKKKEISDLYLLLNKYFRGTGKELVKDNEDNKLTLKFTDKDESISWHLLSRGEKTLMYLFLAVYLYKDKVEVFLLDEPEIALHVSWQEHLIQDLSNLAPLKQFVIATHSPSLVMDGWMDNCLNIKVS